MNDYLETALDAAEAAAEIQMRSFRRLDEVSYKGIGDLVTQVDYRCEDVVRDRLMEDYPDHVVVGEERGEEGDGSHRWIVDPLDGTTNYVHGVPHFCVSIALEVQDELKVAVVYHSPSGEAYTAVQGECARLDGEPINPSDAGHEEALYCTGFTPGERVSDSDVEVLRSVVLDTHGVRRQGAASYDLVCVADGVLDCFYERALYPWDMAAGILIVREAGGRVTDYGGRQDWTELRETGDVVASNGVLHENFLDLIRRKDADTRSES